MKKLFSFIFCFTLLFYQIHSVEHIVEEAHEEECFVCSLKNDKAFSSIATIKVLAIESFHCNRLIPQKLSVYLINYLPNQIRAPPYFS